jgi:acyl carrier protein phosphodiesterase
MNYLAHAYLSFNDPEILVGNMISDFVKGKKKFDSPRYQAGSHFTGLLIRLQTNTLLPKKQRNFPADYRHTAEPLSM